MVRFAFNAADFMPLEFRDVGGKLGMQDGVFSFTFMVDIALVSGEWKRVRALHMAR